MPNEKLINKLKKINPNLKNSDLTNVISVFFDSIKNALKKNQNVQIRGFGTFFIKKIKEKHSARNPKTGELIYIPEKNKIRFRTSKNLGKKINE